LEGIVSRIGALDADDSASLRWWVSCTKNFPVRLYLDVSDCMLGVYLEPITLAQVVHGQPKNAHGDCPPVVVEWVDSKTNDELSDRIETSPSPSETHLIVPNVTSTDDSVSASVTELEESSLGLSPVITPIEESVGTEEARSGYAEAATQDVATEYAEPPVFERAEPQEMDAEYVEPAPQDLAAEYAEAVAVERAAVEPAALHEIEAEYAEPAAPHEIETEYAEPAAVEPAALHEIETEYAEPAPQDLAAEYAKAPNTPAVEPSTGSLTAPQAPLSPPVVENRPLNPEAASAWRHWMHKLDTARGPKPLNAIEQLFINAYVPLSDAYQRGIAGAEARPVLEQWSSSFARSYSEAFDAMRLRGRRPMMVLDIPEAAQRLARLHGARSVQLVLVDAMRFDLGLRVESHLVNTLGQQAALTDRFLLWSALPTTTSQQLELIGRGAEGLKDGDIHSETPVLVARGRQASTLRRIRAGSRELLKLDLVEARLGEPGGAISTRLDQLALEVSDALAVAFSKMPPRTLVAVFGDHGFCLDTTEQGSSAMRQGNASPDEVLVPGFAWLVGQTH
jgi:hypothetical protein